MSPEARRRSWRKIWTFYGLTLLFTLPFDLLDMRASGNLVLVTGSMWAPALAALVTQWLFGASLRELPWSWGKARWRWLAYLLPLAYILPVYLPVWASGIGGVPDAAFVAEIAETYGLGGLPAAAMIALYLPIALSAGFIAKAGRALGEEIGWRGLLVPELSKVCGYTGVSLISGAMWAAWHFPSILYSDYNMGTPPWYALGCFTVQVIAASFVMTWMQLRSGSLWPAVIFHASHNLYVQSIFTPLTVASGITPWVIDEFGAGMALTSTLLAVWAWRRQRAGR